MKNHLRKICAFLPSKFVVYLDILRSYKRILNLKNPKYYGEKIQWIKLNGQVEKLAPLVDKYSVRKYIEEKIGAKYLPKLYNKYENPYEIDYDKLPNKFVLKLNNGSGGNIICKDKSLLDKDVASKKLNKWKKEKFYSYTKEFQYKNIKPIIVCEEYLEDESGSLRDYKLHSFNGKVEFIEVHTDRFKDHKENYYYPNWIETEFRGDIKLRVDHIDKPKKLEELINLAEKLSSGFTYARVDFYIVKDKIYFGELTFTPGNGTDKFYPREWDLKIANMIDIYNYKIGY
ncbi:ATP-grasp fold amidoligase family protein [Clostridium carnis]